MRHLWGIGLAGGLAAAVFFAASWGYRWLTADAVLTGSAGVLHDSHVLDPFAALGGTALVAGIFVAAPRISPLAAGLPGLGLLAWTAGYAVSVSGAVGAVPLRGVTFGFGFTQMLASGVLGAAGLVLVIPLFVPSRWRSRPAGGGRYQPAGQGGWGAVPNAGPSTGYDLVSGDADTAPYPEGERY